MHAQMAGVIFGLNFHQHSYWSRGQISNLSSVEEKLGSYFQSGTCLGALETHALLSFLWSVSRKWLVINITLLTLKIAVHKI